MFRSRSRRESVRTAVVFAALDPAFVTVTVPSALCRMATAPLPPVVVIPPAPAALEALLTSSADTVEAMDVAAVALVVETADEGTDAAAGAATETGRSSRVGTGVPAFVAGVEAGAVIARSTLTAGVVDTELLPPLTIVAVPETARTEVVPTDTSAGTTDPAGLSAVPVTVDVMLEFCTLGELEPGTGAGAGCVPPVVAGAEIVVPRNFVRSEYPGVAAGVTTGATAAGAGAIGAAALTLPLAAGFVAQPASASNPIRIDAFSMDDGFMASLPSIS